MTNLSDFSWYRGNLAWLPRRTIFLAKSGSHAYGTNLPTSDLDIKGVAIPPREYFLGFLNRFEQAESREPIDAVIYDIRKYFALAADCNPNIIEMLFVDDRDVIVEVPAWNAVRARRSLFLSKKARHAFSGYAVSQLKRINTHRRWLLDPPKKHPERSDYGLSEQKIEREQLAAFESRVRKLEDTLGGEGWTKDRVAERDEELVTRVADQIDIERSLIPIILAERRYGAAMRNWTAYQKWKEERNPARAALEASHGYDTKHGMHLVRLMRMALEILGTGQVIVKRPDADELLSIRNGAWSYERLMEWATEAERKIGEVASPTWLPHSPDRAAIDRMLVDLVGGYLGAD
ncbi:MAG TPA: nucleotidyltransferase domain-containing protein [Polyangia bacterium]|nr:nucleotidyltransferase domain-containing protein [Polyangia bacterium]